MGGERVLDEVLAMVLDAALEATGAERGVILLPGPDGALEPRLARDTLGMVLDIRSVAVSRKIPDEVFETGITAVVPDLFEGSDAAAHSGTMALGIRHVLSAPLRLVRYVERGSESRVRRHIGVAVSSTAARRAASSRLRPGPRSRPSPGRRRSRSRTHGYTKPVSRRRGSTRNCAWRRVSSRRCCPMPGVRAPFSRSSPRRCRAGRLAATSSITSRSRWPSGIRARRHHRQGTSRGAARSARAGRAGITRRRGRRLAAYDGRAVEPGAAVTADRVAIRDPVPRRALTRRYAGLLQRGSHRATAVCRSRGDPSRDRGHHHRGVSRGRL